MPPNFSTQVIVITGAGSGIGRATSILLSKHGALLALTDINSSSLAETLSLCTNSNSTTSSHLTSTFDVGSSSACNTFIAEVIQAFDHIDHVFNCAGINPTSMPTATISDAYWDKLIATNLTGLFNMTRACTPHLRRGGSFVNVSSICGLAPQAGIAVYCATKYGVIGFSKCIALEFAAEKGIRTNVVAPGYIDTPTNAGVVKGGEAVEKMVKGVSLGRMGTPEEVADVVAWLMSEEARYVNGSVVEVTGGIY